MTSWWCCNLPKIFAKWGPSSRPWYKIGHKNRWNHPPHHDWSIKISFLVGYDLLLEKLVNHHIKRVDNWQCWDMLRLEMPKCRSQWSPGTSHWWAFQRHTARMPHVAELESLEPPSVGNLHMHQIKSVKRLYTLEMLGDHSASYRSYRQT